MGDTAYDGGHDVFEEAHWSTKKDWNDYFHNELSNVGRVQKQPLPETASVV